MPPAPQGGNQADNSMGALWIVGALMVTSAIIWFSFKQQIVHFYFKIKLAEIALISHFTPRLEEVKTTILATDPSKFTFQDVVRVGQVVGDYMRLPIFFFIFILALLVFLTNTTRLFKRTYSMKDLALLEKDNWPQITPILKLDLIKTDIDKGPWSMALTPMQFCKRHGLLQEHRAQPQEGMTRKEWNRIEVSLKRGQANRIFSLQLGPIWQGVDRLPPHARALFAIFAARYHNDTQAAYDLLRRINVSSARKLDFSGADELVKKYKDTKPVTSIVQAHAYVLTVMASMLAAARDDGVQAAADFLWLKPVDRRLWYMLNTVGRQTPFVEVAGVFAHWVAEKELGRRILVPIVEEATNALELALKDIIYRPDESD